MTSSKKTRHAIISSGLLVFALALAGCSGDLPEPEEGQTESGQVEELGPEELEELIGVDPDNMPSGSYDFETFPFPSCAEIETGFQGAVEHLVFSAEEVEPPRPGVDSFSKTCVWLTDASHRVGQGETDALWEVGEDGGGIVLTINVPPMPITKEEAEVTNYALEDERTDGIGGYVFAPASTDLSDHLGMMGITVATRGVDVTVGAGNAMYESGDSLAGFTKDWGIDVGVAVHELIWD